MFVELQKRLVKLCRMKTKLNIMFTSIFAMFALALSVYPPVQSVSYPHSADTSTAIRTLYVLDTPELQKAWDRNDEKSEKIMQAVQAVKENSNAIVKETNNLKKKVQSIKIAKRNKESDSVKIISYTTVDSYADTQLNPARCTPHTVSRNLWQRIKHLFHNKKTK